MSWAISLPLFFTLALAAPAPASTKTKIDTVPAEYRPNTGAELIEPVSMEDFYFEVNKETARVVVEYTYPNAVDYRSDGDPGPQPSLARLSGLTYDPSAHAVVYGGDEKGQSAQLFKSEKAFGGHTSASKTPTRAWLRLPLPLMPRMMDGVYTGSEPSMPISKCTEATGRDQSGSTGNSRHRIARLSWCFSASSSVSKSTETGKRRCRNCASEQGRWKRPFEESH